MFNWKLPTAQMQGTFSSWSDEHIQSFQSLLTEVGQVCILIETTPDEKNPYSYEKACARIVSDLGKLNFIEGQQYIIMQLPNIKDVNYDKR
jgi:hypothetical protein